MSYSTKKSAQAAARKQYGANYAHHADITLVGEKWEIVAKVDYANSDSNLLPEPHAEVIVPVEILAPVCLEVPAEFAEAMAEPQNPMDYTVCPECGSTELYSGRNKDGLVFDEDKVVGCHHCDWEYEVPKPSMLAGLFGNMTGEVPVPEVPTENKAAPKSTGLTIEKDRPEQNGVKRPSAGGMCRAVWDACWAHQLANNMVPTAKWVKEKAVSEGWNSNNASIEYYQWRKYNGISGRVAAQKPAVEPVAPVEAPVEANSDTQNAEKSE